MRARLRCFGSNDRGFLKTKSKSHLNANYYEIMTKLLIRRLSFLKDFFLKTIFIRILNLFFEKKKPSTKSAFYHERKMVSKICCTKNVLY